MEPTTLPTELILNDSQRSLGQVYLDWVPQPGAYVTHNGHTYAVLERRHRYQFQANRYHLHKIALYVQTAFLPEEKSWVGDRWIVGNADCQYNAQSEILRCAVNPLGPCRDCPSFQLRE
ncbi:MAG: DUF6464 family protein, partial [Cyanobacteria bacterium P01_H01_bin.58]